MEVLNFYYTELSEEQMLEHLMFWLDNFPNLDFEWVNMMLDISAHDNMPIQTIIDFADKLHVINPEYYLEHYEFIEKQILDYAFHIQDIELIKKRIDILKQNPVSGIDTVVKGTMYRLIYYGYYDIVIGFSNAVWKPLAESDQLYGYPEYPFIMTIYLHKLEEQYQFVKNGDKAKTKWEGFLSEILKLGFDNDKRLNYIRDILNSNFDKEYFLNLSDDNDIQMIYLNIHFIKYMKDNYDVPFVLSGLWFNIINKKELFFNNKKCNFFIPYIKLNNQITQQYDNFLEPIR